MPQKNEEKGYDLGGMDRTYGRAMAKGNKGVAKNSATAKKKAVEAMRKASDARKNKAKTEAAYEKKVVSKFETAETPGDKMSATMADWKFRGKNK